MNNLDPPLNTPVAADAPTEAPSDFASTAVPQISNADAEQILEIQAELVAMGQRANMNQVRDRIPGDSHFAGVERNARAVGLLLSETHLGTVIATPPGGGICRKASLGRYGFAHDLDTRDMLYGERWWPPSFASCFLVEDDAVMTALHVFRDQGAADALRDGKLRVVFGYEVATTGAAAEVFCEHQQVFSVEPQPSFTRVLGDVPAGNDWIKLRLVEPATSKGFRAPLSVGRNELTGDTPVYSLGHPNGLPLRYVHTDLPLTPRPSGFLAFLDAYDRSSGSPVFSSLTHKVVGLVKHSSQPSGLVQIGTGLHFLSALCLPGFAAEATLCVDSAAFPP